MLLLVAMSAVILPLLLLVVFRMPARYGMVIAALTVISLAATVWQMESGAIAASALQGAHRAATIIWILCGALFLLFVVQKIGAMDRIKHGFFKVSTDMRVQTVLVAFAFVAILEGVSGFGTPAAIAVPLLVALGFHPLSSVVLALAGDSVPTTFGALGTPLFIGLSNVPDPNGALIEDVASKAVIIDSLFGLLLPLLLVSVLVLWFGRKRERFRDIAEIAPWALLIGTSYVVTVFITVWFGALEFAAIFGGLAALLVGVATARLGVLQPKVAWRHHAMAGDKKIRLAKPTMSLARAWFPYALVVGLLLVQRILPSVREFSQTMLDASWTGILGIEGISSRWHVLYSPGTVLLLAALVSALLFRSGFATVRFAGLKVVGSVLPTAVALLATLIMVQVFANTGHNSAGLASMPVFIGEALAMTFGSVWLAVAPLLGTSAAFIMGSSTVSTLTMAPVQHSVALDLGLKPEIVLAQQISGANAGNSIAVHNVVAASTVSGLYHQEGRIMRHTLPVVLIYIGCTILMTLVLGLFL